MADRLHALAFNELSRALGEVDRFVALSEREKITGRLVAVVRAEVVREDAAEIEQLRDTVARAYAFAEEMRTYCSPHGVAADYANRLEARLKGTADAPA